MSPVLTVQQLHVGTGLFFAYTLRFLLLSSLLFSVGFDRRGRPGWRAAADRARPGFLRSE